MSTSENQQVVAILAAVLVIFHQTKPLFELGQEFDESIQYMKFGRNRVNVHKKDTQTDGQMDG